MLSIFGQKDQTASASTVAKVTDSGFKAEVLDSKAPVLVDFWAPWCGPCKMMAPVLDELSAEYSNGEVTIAKLNVDENPETARKYSISSIPTMLVFRGGKPVGQLVGFMPKPVLKAKLDAILKG